jgi:hypothetical protein
VPVRGQGRRADAGSRRSAGGGAGSNRSMIRERRNVTPARFNPTDFHAGTALRSGIHGWQANSGRFPACEGRTRAAGLPAGPGPRRAALAARSRAPSPAACHQPTTCGTTFPDFPWVPSAPTGDRARRGASGTSGTPATEIAAGGLLSGHGTLRPAGSRPDRASPIRIRISRLNLIVCIHDCSDCYASGAELR